MYVHLVSGRGEAEDRALLFPRVSASGVDYEDGLEGSLRTSYGWTPLCLKSKRRELNFTRMR